MKKFFTMMILVLAVALAMAQSPEKFTYQAVVRNASNSLVAIAPVGVRVSILQGGVNGTVVYMETQTDVTNANGLITLQIGSGNVQQGSFADIDWANGTFFLKTETDPAGGTNYSITTTQQLLSVPYALYAKEAGNAFSGDYYDLTNAPQIPQIPADVSAFNNDAGYLTGYTETDPQYNAWNKDYNDLINKPTIPTVPTNVSAFTNDVGYLTNYTEADPQFNAWDKDYNDLTNKPNLATVATTGNYNDLNNKPVIPTIPQNVSYFTNDAGYLTSADVQQAAGVPTVVSAFQNDAGYITAAQVPAQVNADWNATSGKALILNKPNLFSGNYNDLTNKPTLFDGNYNSLSNKPNLAIVATTGNYNDLMGKPTLFDGNYNSLSNRPVLATVATTGNYNDLSNKPTIPDAANDAILNIQRNGTSVGTFTANASTNKTINIAVPTNVSELGNDAHYVSNAGCASVNLCDLATDLLQLYATLAALNNTIDSLRDRIEELEMHPAQPQTDTTIMAQACLGLATVTDYDLNVYNTVQIGNQCWMRENLRSTHYADGTAIVLGTTSSTTTAYYYPLQGDFTYGYLYNWKAVMRGSSSSQSNPSGVQGICPNGWHVPSDAEWDELENYVSSQNNYLCNGDNTYVAKALAAKTGWVSSTNTCAVGNVQVNNNATGFSAVPVGSCNGSSFDSFGTRACFWSSTESSSSIGYGCDLCYHGAVVGDLYVAKSGGCSVRCLRDGGNTSLLPTVSTMGVTAITVTTAVTGGNITDDGGSAVTARGVCWSTSHNPTIAGNHTNDGEGMGSFTSNLTGLTAGTTYFVRAYATNSNGTRYGDEVSFSTPIPFICGTSTVSDVEGHVYNTVQIGDQCWMKENMRATKYADGTSITQASVSQESITTRYYYVPGQASNYGYLYNWPAAKGPSSVSANNQGICPTGWHVPSDGEWIELTQYVGSQSNYLCSNNSSYIAKALASTTGWNSSAGICAVGNTQISNNATGFSAVPAGYHVGSSFDGSGNVASFWSSTEGSSSVAYTLDLYCNYAVVSSGYGNKKPGYSVRCLRD